MISDDTITLIGNDDAFVRAQIAQSVTSIGVSYTVDGASQVTVELVDNKLAMWNNNYFAVGNIIVFFDGTYQERYMIASHEISNGEGEHFKIKLELRTEAIQRMKMDKKPQALKSTTGYEFAQKVAQKFGLAFIGQQPTGIKTTTIKVKTEKNKESVYDVLVRSAKDLQYLCFVMYAIPEGGTTAVPTLYYGSPNWLLGRWGVEKTEAYTFKKAGGGTEVRPLYYIPLKFPNDPKMNFFLTEVPEMRRSMDSPKESEGSANIWVGDKYEQNVGSAYNIRAGMTVVVYGIKGFDTTAYLITSVAYQYGVPEPLKISFATLDKISPEDKKKIDQKVSETTVIGGG
jgi:hypothetical protein